MILLSMIVMCMDSMIDDKISDLYLLQKKKRRRRKKTSQ